jgi:Na+/H+ antiporter NhaD/arsenite permease-like protein
LSIDQIAAIIIFLLTFIAIISGKLHRYIPAMIGALFTIVIVFFIILRSPESFLSVLNLEQVVQLRFWVPGHERIESHGVNWQTIIFIGGMMVMVEGLGAVGFFRWLCLLIAKAVRYQVIPIMISFMLLSGFLSMFIDSITVLLFLAMVTIELAHLLKFDPVPIIIAEIFTANVGGSATMCGDPPNIIIGTAFGYTFTDFVVNTGPIAWIGMILSLGYFYLSFRRILKKSSDSTDHEEYPEPDEAIVNRNLFIIQSNVFLVVVVLLVTHAQTGLSVALVGCIAAFLTVIASITNIKHILRGVDWRTLLFFIGLFICVGGLEETGVLQKLAAYIGDISGGSLVLVIPIILWVSAFASAIVDNIPFAATMVPVILDLSNTAGYPLSTLSWTLALGTDIGGNATPIGASANVVGTAIAEREGYPIGWGRFCKYAFSGMLLVLLVCWVFLVIRYTQI